MKAPFLFCLLVLNSVCALAKPMSGPSEALYIARAMREADSEEARLIDNMAPLVLNRKFSGCEGLALAEDCFQVFIKSVVVKSSKEALAAMRLAYDAARRDLSDKKLSKVEARVKTNANLIAILERVDLKKSWIHGYELKSTEDVDFVQKLKGDFVQSMAEARSILVNSVEGSSRNISKFKAKSKIARDLTKESAIHLKKIQALKQSPLRL